MPNISCRFFAQGRCSKGSSCTFSHDTGATPAEPELCKFFQRGFCAKGSSCNFHHLVGVSSASTTGRDESAIASTLTNDFHPPQSQDVSYEISGSGLEHPAEASSIDEASDEFDFDYTAEYEHFLDSLEAPESELEPFNQEVWETWAASVHTGSEWKDRHLCPYYLMNGSCPTWRTCPHPHGLLCESCQRWALHPYDNEQRSQHMQQCAERANREESRQLSLAQDCAICLEKVMEKPPSQRCFGLLSCDHSFCLDCVRNWRSHVEGGADIDTALRSCPVCRQTSYFVTPSKVWPRSVEEKVEIVGRYKQKLGTIDCKYWLESPAGDRSCPFGASCFYRHKGVELMSGPRKLLTADGHVKYGAPATLSDFLEQFGLS